jgi:hypothetical protein
MRQAVFGQPWAICENTPSADGSEPAAVRPVQFRGLGVTGADASDVALRACRFLAPPAPPSEGTASRAVGTLSPGL